MGLLILIIDMDVDNISDDGSDSDQNRPRLERYAVRDADDTPR